MWCTSSQRLSQIVFYMSYKTFHRYLSLSWKTFHRWMRFWKGKTANVSLLFQKCSLSMHEFYKGLLGFNLKCPSFLSQELIIAWTWCVKFYDHKARNILLPIMMKDLKTARKHPCKTCYDIRIPAERDSSLNREQCISFIAIR